MTTETTNTETTSTSEEPTVELQQQLTSEQEIQTLRNVHTFLTNYDRVPGSLANQWAQVLDAIALVANSLIAKAKDSGALTETSSDEDATQTAQ